MVDFHSHVLPGMDDGSRSALQSREMLKKDLADGVTKVVCTPHFYADREDISSFLDRRAVAVRSLCRETLPAGITLYLGAEVAYYSGISGSADLCELCIRGTRVLLLEMPAWDWTDTAVDEVISLRKNGLLPVLAHVDRYPGRRERELVQKMQEAEIPVSLNASAFLSWMTRRRALKMVREHPVLLGTDCHDLSGRSPNMGRALEVIRARLGEDHVERLSGLGELTLAGAVPVTDVDAN